MKISYNSPFVLTYALLCTVVLILNFNTNWALAPYVILHPEFEFASISSYISLFGYAVGHANVGHLMGNIMILLLIGPVLEEKYGWKNLFKMSALTAFATAIINLIFFKDGILGASGIVFMFIVLVSFVNAKKGTIPLTFILVVLLWLGQEIFNSFNDDNISQFGHIMGGICGSVFGFALRRNS